MQSKRSDLEDKYIVLYFGSILPLQGADVVLRAIEILREQKNIFFQIIGPITKRYEIPDFFRICDNDIRPSEDIRIDPVTDPGKRTAGRKFLPVMKNIDYIRNVQEIRFLEKYAGKLKLIY